MIHSFGRVVRRHEKDALFQHPSAWWPERGPYSRRVFAGSQLRLQVSEDPFSDARGIRESTTSWKSAVSDSPSSPSPVASTRDRRSSIPSLYPDLPTNRNTLLDLGPSDGIDSLCQNTHRLSGASTDEKSLLLHVSKSGS